MNRNVCSDCRFFQKNAGLLPGTVEAFTALRRRREFRKGEVIFAQGSQPSSVCCIQEGKVDAISIDKRGAKKLIITHDHADGPFPFLAMVKRKPMPVSFVARTNGVGCFLPREELSQRMREDGGLFQYCLETWSSRMESIHKRLLTVLGKSAERKVASALLNLSSSGKQCNSSRKEIAEWTNVAPETVNRMLNKLEKKKLIAKNGQSIELLDTARLRDLVGL